MNRWTHPTLTHRAASEVALFLVPRSAERLYEDRELQFRTQRLAGAEPAHEFCLEVNDAGVRLCGCSNQDLVLEAVLYVIPQPAEELDVGPDRVVVLELVREALAQVPGLLRAVRLSLEEASSP